ncbi:DUF2867 domain-containing protein [Xenorhabdus hominickii]|uniref:DUF2867 domain-containing protein n=1 Tax=Xenorhabdus hominickii TaxID=351679 RepID=A0A2G0Q360_XENHO|nr:DUF2867 domain-containing protein [Xenorhabdus hominickii]AOM39865.1 hypothetical protein A9255_04320 [Xenorhabdus hominickii]PHM53652.1 hypothetical protein Xhom_03651 [Xenorhabdus hominickii]
MYYRDKSGFLLLDKKDKLDYYSQQKAFIGNKVTALDVYNKMTQEIPLWLRISFTIRDKISSLSDVKKIHGFSGNNLKETPRDGSYIDFFKIERISDDEMCLLSKDIHLTVLLSLNVFSNNDNGGDYIITVTASVITHNFFGKMYMIPVSLTHDIIVRSMLSKVKFP